MFCFYIDLDLGAKKSKDEAHHWSHQYLSLLMVNVGNNCIISYR